MNIHVKVCGITDREGLDCALAAGVNAVGFNFHPPSPRFISLQQAAELIRVVPPGVATVGVFANRPLAEVAVWMEETGAGWAQFHGDELPDMLASFSRPWYPVVRPGRGETRMNAEWQAPGILVDARRQEAFGGTGKLADWPAAANLACRMKVILAGGLAPGNLAAAVESVRPWGVDLNSGVEDSPGRKSAALLGQAMDALRPWRLSPREGWL
jgi:phosphoribosylanthranilate isomerase